MSIRKLFENKTKSQIVAALCLMLLGVSFGIVFFYIQSPHTLIIYLRSMLLFSATISIIAGIGILSVKKWSIVLTLLFIPVNLYLCSILLKMVVEIYLQGDLLYQSLILTILSLFCLFVLSFVVIKWSFKNKTWGQVVGALWSIFLIGIITLVVVPLFGLHDFIFPFFFIIVTSCVGGCGILFGKNWGRILFLSFMPLNFPFWIFYFVDRSDNIMIPLIFGIALGLAYIIVTFMLSRPETLLALGVKNNRSLFQRITVVFIGALVMLFLSVAGEYAPPQQQYGQSALEFYNEVVLQRE